MTKSKGLGLNTQRSGSITFFTEISFQKVTQHFQIKPFVKSSTIKNFSFSTKMEITMFSAAR